MWLILQGRGLDVPSQIRWDEHVLNAPLSAWSEKRAARQLHFIKKRASVWNHNQLGNERECMFPVFSLSAHQGTDFIASRWRKGGMQGQLFPEHLTAITRAGLHIEMETNGQNKRKTIIFKRILNLNVLGWSCVGQQIHIFLWATHDVYFFL